VTTLDSQKEKKKKNFILHFVWSKSLF